MGMNLNNRLLVERGVFTKEVSLEMVTVDGEIKSKPNEIK